MGLKLDITDALEPVQSDSPTARAQERTAPEPQRDLPNAPEPSNPPGGKRARKVGGERRRQQSRIPATPEELDRALGAAQKPIATRMPAELWDAAAETAERLDVPLRLLLTHAVVTALQIDDSELLAAVRATERRERLAQIDRI